MPVIRAFLFDAGGTLLHPKKPVGEYYAQCAVPFGGSFDPVFMQDAFKKAFVQIPSLDSARARDMTAYREWWRKVVYRTLQLVGVEESHPFYPRRAEYFDHLYDSFARPEVWALYPETDRILRTLQSRGYRLALVSNWDERLRPLLGALGIDRYFDAMVISSEVGVEKPDPEIFRIALERIQIGPGEAVHVGDCHTHDYLGAEKAGVQALLVDRPAVGLDILLAPYLVED